MRVLLDARSLPGHRLGVAQYVLGLVEEAVDACDLEVLTTAARAADFAPAATWTWPNLPRPLRLAGEAIWDGLVVNRRRPDVFHGVHYSLPPGLRMPAVVTFHDATMLTMPEVHERAKRAWFSRAIPKGVARADQVICVSETARRGAIEHAGAEPATTHAIPLAVDHARFHPGASRPDLVAEICDGPYLLWIGAIEPRKDVPTLLRAFELLATDLPHRLVLVGPDAWGAEEVKEQLRTSPAADRVTRTGWITEDQKAALLCGADAFVWPSLAEGFGLPVLEALACGVPTVTTTGSAPEEVAGDAALLVAPRDVEGLVASVHDALGPARERLRRAGPARAAQFTWARTAAETLDVWRLACA